MTPALLDSFQLIVALYLLYLAVRGKGQMYRFGGIPEDKQPRVRRRLRAVYAAGGLIALADTGVGALQGRMFTVTAAGDGTVITQNFRVEALPFLTYRFLSITSSVLTGLVILLLAAAFVYLRRVSQA